MDTRRLATVMAEYGQVVALPACVLALLGATGVAGIGNTGAPRALERVAPALAANVAPVLANRAAAAPADNAATAANVEFSVVPRSMAANESAPASPDAVTTTASVGGAAQSPPIVVASLSDPAETLPAETAPAQGAAMAGAPDQAAVADPSLSSVEIFDECWAPEACIDRYLWALYRRTPKEDSVKVTDQSRVTVKRKGKMVTITRTSSRIMDEDFSWKDPKAAANANMAMMDYVIGGMDPTFKLKLFRALRAAEQAGLSPGITSAFRDDYRQSIASGLKAANDRSYHGGSFRGGYGHGLAADIVSTKGATRAQRQASSEILWGWVDAHGKEFGIGRPYQDRDPPHVGPIDGQEYADHRGRRQNAASGAEKRKRLAAR